MRTNILQLYLFPLLVLCCSIFSCEKDESSVTGAINETAGMIDTLFSNWGTFESYGMFWLEPKDSIILHFEANDAGETVEMENGMRLDLYNEIHFEYLAVTDGITVRSALYLPNSGHIAYETIDPFVEQRVKYVCPDYKIRSEGRLDILDVSFIRIGSPTDGALIIHDLLVSGVRK